MTTDEIVKALRWLAKETEFTFAAENLNGAADLIESLQADLRHEEKVSHGQMEQNKRLRKMMDKLQAQLSESQRRERAALKKLSVESGGGDECDDE